MNALRGLGLVIVVVLTPIVSFGLWLLATPDYDGGRQAVGGMIVGAAAAIGGLYAGIFFLTRRH